uniref:pleckstrin homology domain-containing family A member 5 isoform X7 n=1 Tax=Monopterus albus TaxID=43700 RepID=UPI0009B30A61|nr:pleckstrin homology domain-containing family A member 5 isoform X7 [Monopterus albus]
MAADLKPEWLSCLPSSWGYGVTRDGRIFFINEEAKSTTWLHPVTGDAVITGHRKTPDLPTGWEEGYTFEGARCFIKNKALTDMHPDKVETLVVAACILQNFLNAPREIQRLLVVQEQQGRHMTLVKNMEGSRAASREACIFFNSPEGSVSWQDRMD